MRRCSLWGETAILRFFLWCLLGISGFLPCSLGIAWAGGGILKGTYPRLMGMNIGAKNYNEYRYQQELAKLDLVILGFYPGWSIQGQTIATVAKRLKTLNPSLLIGQYTILSEAYDNLERNKPEGDKYRKLYKEGWWLKNSAGDKVQWTAEYKAWEVNFTKWAKPDQNGMRYPEWLAERDYRLYFENIPEVDIWYFDNVCSRPHVAKADWNMDGEDDLNTTPLIAQAYRNGHVAEWQAARKLAPKLFFMGNSDSDLDTEEFKGKLQGAFLEGLMGMQWSIETRLGWYKMMERYRAVMANTAEPHLIGFNVSGAANDYRLFRYAFASCLLDNGYFSFTDKAMGYSGVPWFDEYEIDLGRASDLPPTQPWQKGVYRRLFEKGMVLVNPTSVEVTVSIEPGYRAIAGKQDIKINHGRLVTSIKIAGKDGIVLLKI